MKEEYSNKIDITYRSYILVPGETPVKRTIRFGNEPRRQVKLEGPRIKVGPVGRRNTIDVLSLPALQAAKCARLQGEEAFWRFHILLYSAFYDEGKNISEREELISLAAEAGLDIEQFTSEYDSGRQKNEVSAEHDDYNENWASWGIPLAIVGDHYPVLGAVPLDVYRRAIDHFLNK